MTDTTHAQTSPKVLSLVSLLLLSAAVTWLALDRTFFLGGVEADYLGTFVVEAKRFLEGKPLLLKFHLPLYSILIAALNSLIKDWFFTGLLVSWVSNLSGLILCFLFFKRLSGEWAALGAILGFAASETFLLTAAQASSDTFFLALSYGCFLWALISSEQKSLGPWLITGFLMGLAFLTRMNAIALFPLFITPWLLKGGGPKVRRAFSGMILLFLLPILIWFASATMSHSPFFMQEAHLNLAMTYFSPTTDRSTYDAYAAVKDEFESFYDVILRNPPHLIKTYAADFLTAFGRNLLFLILLPIGMIALLGFRSLVQKSKKPFLWVFLVCVLLQLFLSNLKAYETRFYLFLIPLLGAQAGLFLEAFAKATKLEQNSGKVLNLAFFILFLAASSFSIWAAWGKLHPPFALELKEVIPQAKQIIPPESIVVARKPHLAFYTESEHSYFPDVETLAELERQLAALPSNKKVFLYYGSYERQMRNQFSPLSTGRNWNFLIPVAKSERGLNWVLYRFKNPR